ncbi:MAG: hypothetical protein GY950_21945, partial [bacterium]|nr:hypothetical protein [bacterium]
MKNDETASLDMEFQVERYWNIIKPRLHILVFCILLALLAGLVKALTANPLYRAHGILMIAPEQEGTIVFNDTFRFSRPDLEYFNTKVRILKSRSLAKKVLAELNNDTFQSLPEKSTQSAQAGIPGFNEDPGRKIDFFLAKLKVEPLRETRLARVSSTSGAPETAAPMVNTLFSRVIAFTLDLRTESTRRA